MYARRITVLFQPTHLRSSSQREAASKGDCLSAHCRLDPSFPPAVDSLRAPSTQPSQQPSPKPKLPTMAFLNMNNQRPLLSAHPLHYALTIFLFFTTLGLYNHNSGGNSLTRIRPARFDSVSTSSDLTLSQRLSRSEALFQTSRERRTELFTKYGEDPESYSNHPEGPWPAMTVWDFFYPAFNCPHEMERIGATGDGGKWVCGFSRVANTPCVIYSFGELVGTGGGVRHRVEGWRNPSKGGRKEDLCSHPTKPSQRSLRRAVHADNAFSRFPSLAWLCSESFPPVTRSMASLYSHRGFNARPSLPTPTSAYSGPCRPLPFNSPSARPSRHQLRVLL